MPKQRRGWDPELKRYCDIVGEPLREPKPGGAIIPQGSLPAGWRPMTDREAAEYEIRRAQIIAQNGGES